MRDQAFVVCMAMDAFRLAMGLPTKNQPPAEVMRWLEMMQRNLTHD